VGSKVVDMVINGEPIKVDVAKMLDINDLSDDMDKVASQMGYWGSLWAAAEGERELADAFYRQWRAQTGKKIVDADSKMAEWKVRQAIEAHSKFIEIKGKLSQAIHNATLCKTVCEAWRIKSNMLQSKGAMMRAELDSTGMSTKKKNRKTSGIDASDDPKTAMKKIFKGKK
jgi:hypothetical protein